MNDNSNDDINMMAKYFVHSSKIQNDSQNPNDASDINNIMNKDLISSKNINQNINNFNTNMNSMNTSFESTMTNQMNLNNEIINDLMGAGEDYQDKKLIKLIRTFKKNIKLRNATIKKNFWKRDYINNKLINIKIGTLFPILEPTQGFCLCIYNYMNNKQFKELICKVENEIIVNKINNNINNLIEKYTIINQEENQLNNLLINPISYLDNNKHRKELIKLISSIYYRIKSLKIELGKSKENYIFNYLVIKSKIVNNNKNSQRFIYGKLYSVFPNINFQLHEINKLSLSSKFKLNKLLISKKHINIQNEKGIQLTNGFITMSNEKRIITLTDDTNKKELQESQSLKQIIFGIWLSLKYEDATTYENIEIVLNKHKHFIYRKCLEFVLASPKIETIFSPSPDEGIFLLIIFFKNSQCYFEVKIIPNEEDKYFKDDSNNENKILENFNNQWIIRTQKFDFCNNNGQFFFNFQPYFNRNKFETMNDFINRHLNNKKKPDNNIDNYNNFNNKNINTNNMNNINNLKNNFNNNNNYYNNNNNFNNNMNSNNYYYNSYNNIENNLNNNFDNNHLNNNRINNMRENLNSNQLNNNLNNLNNNNINQEINNNNLNNEINNQYINQVNNNFNNSTNSGFGMSSQGFKDSKGHKETPNKLYRASHSQKKLENIPYKEKNKNKEIFDPLTDIFEHNNNNIETSGNSNNNIPYVKNKNFQQSQSLYSTNNNNPKTSYNPNEYLKMGQINNNIHQIYNQENDEIRNMNENMNENINMNENVNEKINENMNENMKENTNENINDSKKNLINENKKILNNIGSVYGDINDENWLSQSNFGGMNLPLNNQGNKQDMNMNNFNNMNNLMNIQNRQNENMFRGQIMMNNNINNNINILNNINNNNINNSNREREEISQQSNTNYSQYTLGKKVYSSNCSNNDSMSGMKNQDLNINISSSNKKLNQLIKNNSNEINTNLINTFENNLNLDDNKGMTPKMNSYNKYSQEKIREQQTYNISKKITFSSEKNVNYSNNNANNNVINNFNQYDNFNQNKNIIQKEDKATQTINEEKASLNNNSQIQSLNIIINEQSQSIQALQNKVNNLEELLAKVNLLLKRKNEKEKEKNNDLEISNENNNDNENDNENNENNDNNENNYSVNNKSESLKNSGNNSKDNLNNKNNISNLSNNNNKANNISNKLNEEVSNDNLYKIKNCSNLIDSNNKYIIGGNKNILVNEESLDNDLSSDLNISESRNSKELNKSGNVGDKTIEIPKIKYNSNLLNSNNDETENDISSN